MKNSSASKNKILLEKMNKMRNKTNNLRKENILEGDKNILAIDLGNTTGWAIRHGYGVDSGSVSFKPNRFDGGGMRYLRFQHWLTETLDTVGKIDEVYFEEVRRHLGVDAAHAYGGFLSHLTSWCEMHTIPYQGVPVGTIKRFITGKGNASKLEVIKKVKALGHSPTDNNEADALSLLHLAMQKDSSPKKLLQEAKNEH